MEEPPPPSSPPPPPPPPVKTYTLTATSISYTKTPTTTTKITSFLLLNPCISVISPPSILQDIYLTAYPSQILAIVGPSGAGKSTLLDILATRTAPTTGTLLLNSSPITPSTYRKLSAYVPQHDYSLPVLTVSETFAFAARLLQPKTTQISTLVTSLVTELGLTHVAHTKLGHNLSGGERRRVSIGLSLLHDPGVLLLDEPTSGLDSTSAYTIMQTLKSIATARLRTIILSIHQPSFKLLTTIDRILLLSKGKVVHHGTLPSLQENLLSNGFTLPPQLNSLEYAMEILTQLPVTKPVIQTSPTDSTQHVGIKHDHIRYRSSRVEEIVALYGRFWKIIYRVEKRCGLFAFTLTFLLSSTTETLPIFINERPILLRETSGGVYRLSSYLIANTLVFFPYLLAIAIIYSVSVYFLVGLCQTWQAFGYFVLVIWVIVLMANSFILFLSSIAPNYITGTSLVTILLAGFFLFSGYFISKESMPKYWLFMHYFSMYKYALDAMLINEYSCLTNKCMIWYDEKSQTCMMTGADVLEKKGLHENQRWINIYILIGFFVFYRVLCFFFLVRRVSRSKK
ncbi:putative ABC-type sulfate transporter [Helianthus annuus]|nr:putative ABC-type sulfate transporter [Helianthus annuus]